MIIHANDTDIIVMSVYYVCTLLKDLPELCVRTAPDNYLPIHDICAALGPAQCHALPFLHSLSGRDATRYPYFTGKNVWVNKTTDISALGNFVHEGHAHITADVINQASEHVIAVYTNKEDAFEG